MDIIKPILTLSFVFILFSSYALSEPVILWQFDDGNGKICGYTWIV
jgi:hypothetical protein